jgi:hypothetical protein
VDELIEAMARAILKTRWYDCEPDAYDSLESFFLEIDPDHWTDARDEARAALAAIHARGDRVVPGVGPIPTQMLSSVCSAYQNSATIGDGEPKALAWDFFAIGYTAMLSASPYAPEKEPK